VFKIVADIVSFIKTEDLKVSKQILSNLLNPRSKLSLQHAKTEHG